MYQTIGKQMSKKVEIMRLEEQNGVFMHYHNYLELVYVISGEANHTLGGKAGSLRRGNYFVVDYNTAHHYVSERCNLGIINCLFLPEFLGPAFSEAKSFNELCEQYYFKETGRLINGPTSNIVFDDDGTVGTLFLQMDREHKEQKEGYLSMLRYLLGQIIIETIRKVGSNDKISNQTAEIIHFINQNFEHKITLDEVCNHLGYSVPYISGKFKKETGFTFTKYLQNRRIEAACRMLATTDMSIIDIAEKCGYNDLKFFGKVFKQVTKVTPRYIRKQSRGI
ncbi:MAG: helix-turn-helix domain-containing protein [Clostridia bacterium]|nr:helix-turn-helix domain-containing protein [Clostridia bacterium]